MKYVFLLIAVLGFGACMDFVPIEMEDFDDAPRGDALFIVNEGNFNNETASLSVYYPDKKKVENEIFYRANGKKLGDVAQSMVIRNGKGYIIVNNSGAVYEIDIYTFKVTRGMIRLGSPRYIHFLSDTKAYLTDLYSPRILIFNPQTMQVVDSVETHGHKSTEQMIQYDKYVFTNSWSYDNKILVIDTEKDELVDSISLGIQPTSLVLDKYNKIWTVTDGGYEGSPYGNEAPSLYCIDAATRKVEKQFTFKKGDSPSEVALNGTRDTLYFINKDIWKMSVTADRVPVRAFVKNRNTKYYGLTVDPRTSEVYVADGIDYQQEGIIYRYTPAGELVDYFTVGIIPGAFCFR